MTSLSLNKEETILEQMNKLHDMEVLTCKDFLPNQKQIKSANIAATVLKVQEKKTQKGTSY